MSKKYKTDNEILDEWTAILVLGPTAMAIVGSLVLVALVLLGVI